MKLRELYCWQPWVSKLLHSRSRCRQFRAHFISVHFDPIFLDSLVRQSATKEGILCSYIIWSLTSTPEHEAPLRADSLGMGRRKDENKRLGVKEIDRLCRLTTTALTTIKNLLKLLSCQIREILKSLNSSGAL